MTEYQVEVVDTLCALPRGAAEDAPALVEVTDATSLTSVHVSYGLLRALSVRLADELYRCGVRAGDVVCFVHKNSIVFVVVFLAITRIGATASPLNPAYTADEFAFYMEDMQAKLLLADEAGESPACVAAKRLGVRILTTSSSLTTASKEGSTVGSVAIMPRDALQPREEASSRAEPESIAMLLHTSGTTSRPKGVPISHKNLTASLANIARTYELTTSDVTLLVMPLFHVHGLIAATLTTLASGGCVVIPPGGRFSASAFWPIAAKFHVSWYTAVPTIHQVLLARAEAGTDGDVSFATASLRFIRSCSSSLAPAILERVEARFGAPVLEAYGMTEAAHQMSSNPLPKYGTRRAGTVGIGQGVQIAILNNETNESLPTGEIGEVCIRGDNVTRGYLNNEAANESAFAAGWFHTGDQGKLDEDGFLTLTGRIKELINRGGEKISPLELDAALLAHEMVAEAVSFGAPDEKYGEAVNAAVVLVEGHSTSPSVEEDILNFVRSRLAPFKVPTRLFITDAVPKTATGKIQRRFVAAHFLEGASA
uniref:4-coumarate--CoA ligase n=1 Tax=Erythrolobus australicus TaxID=1077150 RepID=A0A7S1TNL4_9RHOD